MDKPLAFVIGRVSLQTGNVKGRALNLVRGNQPPGRLLRHDEKFFNWQKIFTVSATKKGGWEKK